MPKGPAYLLNFIVVICVALLLAGLMAWERFDPDAYGPQPEYIRSGQEASIKRAEFASGRLWLLSDGGELWSVAEHEDGARKEPLSQMVLSLCASNNEPAIVTADLNDPEFWIVRRRRGNEWVGIGKVAKSAEGLVGLACTADSLTVLTARRMVSLDGFAPRTQTLSLRIPARPINAILTTPTHLLVGLAEGEFGGGLMSIDRQSGEVVDIARNTSGELCGGPLNPYCDPVNALAPIPWKPDCAVAAIGLIHFAPHGRLAEICGGRVERLYVGPCPYPSDPLSAYSDGEPYCTEAFYGVAPHDGSLMSVGTSGISIVAEDGTAQTQPLPAFRNFGPFEVSFGRDVVLVYNKAGGRNAITPETPLLVPRTASHPETTTAASASETPLPAPPTLNPHTTASRASAL